MDVYNPFEDPSLKAALQQGSSAACVSSKQADDTDQSAMLDILGANPKKPPPPVDLLGGAPSVDLLGGGAPANNPSTVDLLGFDSPAVARAPGPESAAAQELMNLVNSVPKSATTSDSAKTIKLCVEEPPAKVAEPSALPAGLEGQHVQSAVKYTTEGRWVPKYMRNQLAENGHITLPTGVNAHEHKAGAPPPSLVNTLGEMGQEIGQLAEYSFGFLSGAMEAIPATNSMSFESIGETIWGGQPQDEEADENLLFPLSAQTVAGLGPVRSQLKEVLHGIDFARLLDAAKSRFVNPHAPQEFQRIVTSRSLLQDAANHDGSVEGWLFSTELNTNVLSSDTVKHLCLGSLRCKERWYIERHSQRASVILSTNGASYGPVAGSIGVDIVGQANGCLVESRLFAMPRVGADATAPFPVGFVEELTRVFTMQADNLRRDLSAALILPGGAMGHSPMQRAEHRHSLPVPCSTPDPFANVGSLSGMQGNPVSSGYSMPISAAPTMQFDAAPMRHRAVTAAPIMQTTKQSGAGLDDPFAELTAELYKKPAFEEASI